MKWGTYKGWIEVIAGPMFSGKTSQLILRVIQSQAVGQKVQVFRPKLDTRYAGHELKSHSGLRLSATPIGAAKEILNQLARDTRVVAIDEGQFLDPQLVRLCSTLAYEGKRVVVAGLDTDFRGEPFGPIPELLAVAEVVEKLKALCAVCGEPASLTQRLINGQPARYSDPLIVLGDHDLYEPRCRVHHVVVEREALIVSQV